MEQVAGSPQEPPELAPETAPRPQTDRFMDEIRYMHRLRAELGALSPAQRAEVARRLGDGYADDWILTARDAQLPPPDLSWCWLLLGGRGTGKTRALSGAVHIAIRAGLRRIHVISPSIADYREVMVNGPSGLMATCDAGERPRWIASRRQLEWENGARVTCFSAEDPESLRGPQAELVVCDEIARMRYQQEVFDNAMFGLRLGDRPRIFLATTPRTTLFMKRLLAMKGVTLTTGSTYDNDEHLPPEFLAKIREFYEGTRLGRQELQGAMILEPENALFKDDWLVHHEVPEDLIEQVTVGVDPSGGGDEIGIVVCALLTDGRFAILADRTVSGSPGTWGEAVVRAHDDFDADDCTVEINY
ncbi:MAG: DNA-packaging protein [Bradyrhizobium sp.]|nr:DNA-packaging protein [Bradyrhizobium sp.]